MIILRDSVFVPEILEFSYLIILSCYFRVLGYK